MYPDVGLPNAVNGFLSGLVFELHFRDAAIQNNLSGPSSNIAVRGFSCLCPRLNLEERPSVIGRESRLRQARLVAS